MWFLFLALHFVVSLAVKREVRYQNWRHLSRADPFCSPQECALSEVGEVSIDEISGCLNILKKKCHFTVEAVHRYYANFRETYSYICWAPEEGPAGVSGLSVPDFYPEKDFMKYADELQGSLELLFFGLNIPASGSCDLFLLNQDVRFERGCGWDTNATYYNSLIPSEPYYTFKGSERRLIVKDDKLKKLLHAMRGPGLFFVFTDDACSVPLSSYSFTFTSNLTLRVSGVASSLALPSLLILTYLGAL